MHIIHVVPIARGIPFDTLTYYHSDILEVGTFVLIPLGRQTIVGIVTETSSLLEAKALIKGAAFSLKKVASVLTHIPFFAQVIGAAKETSIQTLTPVGAILASVIPSIFFEYINAEKVADLFPEAPSSNIAAEDVITGTGEDRADLYKRIIRSSFASKQSVLFIAPTIKSLEHWKEQLEKGIGKHVVVMHSKVTKKNLRSAFSLIKTSDRPLIIFATPGYMIMPRSDFGLVIAEEESTNLYKTNDRYATDLRIFIRQFALCAKLKLQWGDTMPRFETLERLEKTHLPRTYIPDKLHIVPIEHYRTILPTEVMELIRHAEKKKRRLFIYTNRKGIAPLSRCSDCGTIVTCEECSLPMVLRNRILADGTKERFFVCTHCAATLPASHLCSYCGSWNITPVSIGTESIRDAIVSLVGEEAVITIDDDITPDAVAVQSLIERAQKQKFAIVIGTIKVLPYLKGIHYALFPFFDRLLSIPSLYTTEDALRLVMQCNERVSEGVIICTKNPTFPFLKQLETHKINAIVFDELSLRRDLGYPPFGTIIKLSFTVPDGHRERVIAAISAYLGTKSESGIDTTQLPVRRVSHGSMKVLLSWIIRGPATYIEEDGPELASIAESLRFPYKIEQNPERL